MTEQTTQPARPIELDEMQILRDQVANLSMKLAQALQEATRHQAISNQLAQQIVAQKEKPPE